jgi:hypothetical protein
MLNNFCEEPSDMKVISWCLQTKMHRLWDHPPARQGPTQGCIFNIYTTQQVHAFENNKSPDINIRNSR